MIEVPKIPKVPEPEPLRFKEGRALPLGKQWVGHDKPGKAAARRRLKQQQRLAEKRLRRAVADGRVPVSETPIEETSCE